MGKIETVRCKGESGKTYCLDTWSLEDPELGDFECVYIYSKRENGSWIPIYIGETTELATRIDRHKNGKTRSDKCIRSKDPTHIHIYYPKPGEDREKVETDIRHAYNNTCNKQGVNVNEIDLEGLRRFFGL